MKKQYGRHIDISGVHTESVVSVHTGIFLKKIYNHYRVTLYSLKGPLFYREK